MNKNIQVGENMFVLPIDMDKDGVLADIESIHRMTIDRAVEKKQKNEE